MVAVAVDAPRALRVFDMPPVEPPGTGEVTVRVERAGICGSDLHILHGSNPFARYPRVIGHEFAGVVEALGARRWEMGSQTSLSARRRSSIRSSHAVIATRAG